MLAYRIVKARHARDAFTGEGARLYGGRWNHAGVPMVYAAQTRALAALESLVHFSGAERGIAFVSFEVEIPDRLVMRLEVGALPDGWRSAEPSPQTQRIGSQWQRSRRSVALAVPSVLIPQEWCLLLNPEHGDARKVMVRFPEPFDFDSRL
jgi:RES domain-containing protein